MPLLPILFSASLAALPADELWQTPAEASGYTRTPRLAETMDWFGRLADTAPALRVRSFGISPEGRELPLLILSRDGAFSPLAARELGKPVVLVQACIHPGENEGKDALMAFARDLLLADDPESRALLDALTLLIVPVFNVDGHERFSPYNRINQNGPDAMGWRATAQNLNLNRDFIKADAPEMQAWLALWNAWQPDLLVDLHNTNGADYQYELTWAWERAPNIHPALSEWQRQAFEGRIQPALEAQGWKLFRYVTLADSTDLQAGLLDWASTPRFSCGYAAAAGRACLLVETHMLKDFETRTRVNEALLWELLRELQRSGSTLRAAVNQAREALIAREPGSQVPIAFRTADEIREVEFLGYAYTRTPSALSGGIWVQYDTGQPTTFVLPMRDRIEVAATIDWPLAWWVPAAWTEVIRRLELHGIEFERIDRPLTVRGERQQFSAVEFAPRPFEGRQMLAGFAMQPEIVDIELPPGSVRVPAAQPRGAIAMHLLEPASPDALLRWGFFNAIFEDKEYAEARVIEAMAREMLSADPALQAAFETALEDPDFAASPRARLRFFYERTPYFDARLNRYPVLRELAR